MDGHTCKVHAELLRPAKINDWQIPKSETGRPIRKAAYVIPPDDSESESLSESENEVTSSNLQNESDQIIQKSELDIRSDRSGDVSDQDLDLPLNKLAEKYRRERAHSDYEDNIPLMELAKRFKARTDRHKLEQLTDHKSGNCNSELENKPKIEHNSDMSMPVTETESDSDMSVNNVTAERKQMYKRNLIRKKRIARNTGENNVKTLT